MNKFLVIVACIQVIALYSMDQSGKRLCTEWLCPIENEKENEVEQYQCLTELMKTRMLLFIEQYDIMDMNGEDALFAEKYQEIVQKIDQINEEIRSYYRGLKIKQLVREVHQGKKS